MRVGNYAYDPDLAWVIGEKIVTAIVVLLVTWLLAKAAKWTFAQLVDKIELLRRGTGTGDSIGISLGRIVALLIWLFGLLAVLQVFELGGVMSPVQALLNDVMEFIPNLIGAGLIFFIGLLIARIVKELTVTGLQTVNFDSWANRGGVDDVTGNRRITGTIETIAFVLVIVPVSIMALEALELETVSAPASEMLTMFFDAVPRIIGAALVLGIGYLISRFVVQILGEILPGLGVDRSVAAMNVLPEGTRVSAAIARIVQVAIMLFSAIAATRLLGFPELTAILDAVLELGGKVVFGGIVIGTGFLIASLLARLVAGASGTSLAAGIVKWATTILFTFMGLEFMGVGDEIVRLAFGALVVGGAAAAALAFGLGGRDAAAKMLDDLRRKE